MAKLTKDQALDGLQKLHALTKDTAEITRPNLQKACGLRVTDMLVLIENDIISCTGKNPIQWAWIPDVVPNSEMATRMLTTKVKAWDKRPEKPQETVEPQDAVEEVSEKEDVVPGVKVYKTYEITKQYGVDVYSMTLRESPTGWDHTLPTNELDSASADMLRAVGSALVVAAAIMDGKGV